MIPARDALGWEAPPPPRSEPRARLHLALPRDKAKRRPCLAAA